MHGGVIEGQLWNSSPLCVRMQHSQPLMRTESKVDNKK